MALSLGIRLVIIFPTLLFLVGFTLKSIVDRKSCKRILDKYEDADTVEEMKMDFYFILAIDSLLLTIANGLILIFELQQTEIGIITIIIGVLLSMCLLTGIYAKSDILVVGFVGIFPFLSGEFAYFCTYDTPMMNKIVPFGVVLGIFLVSGMAYLGSPGEKKPPEKKVKKTPEKKE